MLIWGRSGHLFLLVMIFSVFLTEDNAGNCGQANNFGFGFECSGGIERFIIFCNSKVKWSVGEALDEMLGT